MEKQVKKKPVGWPKREKETKDIIEVLYNFQDLYQMVNYEEFYFKFFCWRIHANCAINKTRKRLSLCKKLEIREYYAIHKSYRETERVFGLQDLNVRKICKAAPPKKTNKRLFGGLKGSKHFKGNRKGAGKPLSYPIEFDQKILVWSSNPSFKLSSLTIQDIVNWVHGGCIFLRESNAIIQRSFEVRGITTTNPWLVCNDDFLKRIMANVEVNSDWSDDDDDMFKDLFEN